MMAKTAEDDSVLPGFDVPVDKGNTQDDNQKKKAKKSGGFQSMGFSFPILKGITKRGYKQPTPIQRKTIPLALEGKDVVAMARTGSGKTACFVLPILEKLISPTNKDSKKTLRALILSPTRELVLQTLKFVRELGKFTGLSSAAILGGESIEHQFSVMSGSSPDIVVATPGRFLHICVEMNLKLDKIKVVVFDEADRLFELGFGEQLREIVARLPSHRQTLLFSATLPKMLVEFARAGLTNPVLVRLDVDWKLPETLWLGWLSVRAELKTAALILLLNKVLTEKAPQAVVFAATKHHVEYLHLVLQKAGISSTYAYSGLDPSARKIALGRFTNNKCSVLIVTDVAARGLDLPSLDTVINYNFPAKPKLFVHRVGRSARAGRAGRAFSLVAAEDMAHLLDLQLFLNTQLLPAEGAKTGVECPSGIWGTMDTSLLEMTHQEVVAWEKNSSEIEEAARICARGWQQYVKWREPASAEANRRAKLLTPPVHPHPFLAEHASSTLSAARMLAQLKNYTPKGTILEVATKNDSPMYLAMKAKKIAHGNKIEKIRELKKTQAEGGDLVVTSAKTKCGKRKHEVTRDENYIPHEAGDQHTETGLAVCAGGELELGADSADGERARRTLMRWDRRRMKMVQTDPSGGRKMIRTESGNRVPASYRSGRYDEWKKRAGDLDADSAIDKGPASRPRWAKHNERAKRAPELVDKMHIVKQRLRKEKIKQRLKHKMKNKRKKKK